MADSMLCFPLKMLCLPIPQVNRLQVVILSDCELNFRVLSDSHIGVNLVARQQRLAEIEAGIRG